MTEERLNRLSEIEDILGYAFADRKLLTTALTHSSRANELTGDPADGNERLEFLGDAVLEEEMSVWLYRRLPDSPEGRLTKLRAQIVCEKALASVSRSLGLNGFLRLGKGEELSGGRERDSIIADGVEALIGAVFLDGGQEAARALIGRLFSQKAEDAISGRLPKDSKSELQEHFQALGEEHPEYEITGESGPAHAKVFEAAVYQNGKLLGRGKGLSKQAAQTAAAEDALRGLRR